MKKTILHPNGKFVPVRMALKGGKTKADYIAACKEKGLVARYSGKQLYDLEGSVNGAPIITRQKGFYLTPA